MLFFIQALSAHPVYSAPPGEKINPKFGEYASFTPEGDIRRFDGESLLYNISLLWFKNAATGHVSFFKKDGRYQALLVGETKGFIGWVTAYRKHIYQATFELVDNNRRVRTTKFERKVIIGKNVEQTINYLDYRTRKHSWSEYKNGELVSNHIEDIPAGVIFDDILAAFYNFRNGVYGGIRKGKTYTISTIPEKGVGNISIHIETEKGKEAYRKRIGRDKRDEYLLEVLVPKKIFNTKSGKLVIWGSKHLIPIETTVEDYIMLGDLHAQFARRINHPLPHLQGVTALKPGP